jgi:hypothetical protein
MNNSAIRTQRPTEGYNYGLSFCRSHFFIIFFILILLQYFYQMTVNRHFKNKYRTTKIQGCICVLENTVPSSRGGGRGYQPMSFREKISKRRREKGGKCEGKKRERQEIKEKFKSTCKKNWKNKTKKRAWVVNFDISPDGRKNITLEGRGGKNMASGPIHRPLANHRRNIPNSSCHCIYVICMYIKIL